MKKYLFLPLLLLFLIGCSSDDSVPEIEVPDPIQEEPLPPVLSFTPCEGGLAGIYSCQGADLLARMGLSVFNASAANDIWGWTDPETGREYALVGLDNGTAFVDISDTENLIYLGRLLTRTSPSTWRDIKVYQNYAFIGSEAPGHGMQIFDLTKLRNVDNPPENFTADQVYDGFSNSHNIVINEATSFVYAVGTGNDAFNGGVHFVDITDPLNPQAGGGFGALGYTHDAQVVTYAGPDADYTGREILIGANEDRVVIVDVTDKGSPFEISSFQYGNIGYTHQGWFTEDQRYFILGDETDEINDGFRSRTLIFDLNDLDNPILHSTYLGPTTAIDHNGYVNGNQFYLANYTAGIRILDISSIATPVVNEIAYFDTFVQNNQPSFNGAWSVYPYFSSGKILVNDINSGLFVIRQSN